MTCASTLQTMAAGVTILAYHRFGARTPVSVDLPVGQVADQFDWIQACAVPLSLDAATEDLVAGQRYNDSRPRVVLTADDGTADWVDVLLPILVERRLPMTWYVATRFVDDSDSFPYDGTPISWAGLREAASTGLVTVASHTHSHAVMTRLDGASAAQELDRSVQRIEDELGVPCLHFAYPKALLPSAEADREVRRRFLSAALAGNRVNVPGRCDPARLGRTPIKRSDDAGRFMTKLHGGRRLEGWLRERYDLVRHHDAVT